MADAISFTLDTTGAGGGTPIAPTAANSGKYTAGSFLTLSGGVQGTTSGITAKGNFGAQVASSGAFSTGNPGSLTAFYGGSLAANVDFVNNTITFPGGSLIDAQVYDAKYPEVAGAAVPLSPGVGGGVTGTPGSAPADYGVSLKVTASVIFTITVLNGTAALRDTVLDIQQIIPGSTIPLSGPAGNQTFSVNNNVETGIISGNLDANLKGTVLLGNTIPDVVTSVPLGGVGFAPNGTATAGTLTYVINPDGSKDVKISIPIKATVTETITGDTPITATITLTGSMAGFAHVLPTPEPGSIALATLAGLALVPYGYRRYRRSR